MTTIDITNENQLAPYYTRSGAVDTVIQKSDNIDFSLFTTRAAAEAHYNTKDICPAMQEWEDVDFDDFDFITFTVIS